MDPATGASVIAAMKRAGIRLEDLALRARVPASTLSALAQGSAADLSTAAAARIARVLDVDVSDLLAGTPQTSQPSIFFLQAGVPDFFDSDRGTVVDALRQARSIAVVDEVLRRRYLRSEFSVLDVEGVPFEHGYALARRVRAALGRAVEPLGSISEIIEDGFGVPVFAAPFRAPHLVALTAKERASDLAAVIVNASSTTHRRVDLAHELAHVLFDETVDEVGYWLDLEAHREADASRSEQRARAFAAELLIPRRGLAELVGHAHEHVEARSSLAASMDLTRRVGHHFHASPELTTNHLVNNGYISDALREEVSRAVTIPPFPASPRRPMLHRRLAEALEAGLITQMRAREMLGISARDPLPADVEPGP